MIQVTSLIQFVQFGSFETANMSSAPEVDLRVNEKLIVPEGMSKKQAKKLAKKAAKKGGNNNNKQEFDNGKFTQKRLGK